MCTCFTILYFSVEFLKIYYLFSIVLAFIIASIVNFFLQKRFTFKDKNKKYSLQFSSFLLIGVVGMGINLFVVYMSVELLHLWYIFGKIFATGIAFIWNFLANRFITFRFYDDKIEKIF